MWSDHTEPTVQTYFEVHMVPHHAGILSGLHSAALCRHTVRSAFHLHCKHYRPWKVGHFFIYIYWIENLKKYIVLSCLLQITV